MRRWLRRNKIFFDTVAVSLLSLMAVVVSGASYLLLDRQTRALEVEKQAFISVNSEQIWSPELSLVTDDRLRITNDGGPVRDVVALVETFIEATWGRGGQYKEVTLRLDGYYTGAFITAQPKGVLATHIGNSNVTSFARLERDFAEKAKERGLEIALLRLQRYVRVTYTDVLGMTREEYFHVLAVAGGTRIPLEEGRKRSEAEKRGMKSVQLGVMTSGELLDVVTEEPRRYGVPRR
jgi:hypothetical protein